MDLTVTVILGICFFGGALAYSQHEHHYTKSKYENQTTEFIEHNKKRAYMWYGASWTFAGMVALILGYDLISFLICLFLVQ